MSEHEQTMVQVAIIAHRDLLTVKEAALWFDMSERWFYDRIELKDIPYYRDGRLRRVSKQEVEQYLRRDRVSATSEMQAKATRYIMNNRAL